MQDAVLTVGVCWKCMCNAVAAVKVAAKDFTSVHMHYAVLAMVPAGASGEGMWRFPHAQHREGETIRQTAERALAETLTEDPDRCQAPSMQLLHACMLSALHSAEDLPGDPAALQVQAGLNSRT